MSGAHNKKEIGVIINRIDSALSELNSIKDSITDVLYAEEMYKDSIPCDMFERIKEEEEVCDSIFTSHYNIEGIIDELQATIENLKIVKGEY